VFDTGYTPETEEEKQLVKAKQELSTPCSTDASRPTQES